MKILGTKFSGVDSSISYINSDKKEHYALHSDRVSRIKKDNFDIDLALKYFRDKNIILNELDKVSIPFSDFSGSDAILDMQCPTYFWLEKERIKREIIKPKYFKDLVNISFKKKIFNFF